MSESGQKSTSTKLKIIISTLSALILTTSILTYNFNLGYEMTSKYTPLIDAAMEIKLEATTAHLWFEEIMCGDKIENLEMVNTNINNAIWYANAMLYGNSNNEGTFLPLENKNLEIKIKNVLKNLKEFKNITDQRYAHYAEAAAGSKYDQTDDAIFKKFIKQADMVESELQQIILTELNVFKQIYIFILIGLWTLIIIVSLLLYNYEKQKDDNLLLLTKSNNKLKKSLDIIDSSVLTFEVTKDKRILSISTAFCVMSGYTKEELIGKSLESICSTNLHNDTHKILWNSIENGKPWSGELSCNTKYNTTHNLFSLVTPSTDEYEHIQKHIFINEDITDKKKIEEIAKTDVLTHICNRFHLDIIFKSEFEKAKRYNTTFSIIFLDIDYFKKVNDTYGHDIGDSVLIEISDLVKSNIRKSDIIGRWGGEEFIIICSETKVEDAYILAEKLRKLVEEYNFKTVKHKTCSFGVSSFLTDDKNYEEIVKRADDALYKAKNSGRNKVVLETL